MHQEPYFTSILPNVTKNFTKTVHKMLLIEKPTVLPLSCLPPVRTSMVKDSKGPAQIKERRNRRFGFKHST